MLTRREKNRLHKKLLQFYLSKARGPYTCNTIEAVINSKHCRDFGNLFEVSSWVGQRVLNRKELWGLPEQEKDAVRQLMLALYVEACL